MAPSVLEAMSRWVIGHLDPVFLDEITEDPRWLFQTENRMTFPVSGTSSAGAEAAVFNLVEPGEAMVVGVNGVFGSRIAEEGRRPGRRSSRSRSREAKPFQPRSSCGQRCDSGSSSPCSSAPMTGYGSHAKC